MKILVFAAHPDDAECVVGGSICHYSDLGHTVHIVNMTNNGTQRVACADRAAATLGCTVEFLDFVDVAARGEHSDTRLGMVFDEPHLQTVHDVLLRERPDLVWAHWPVDTHPDHMAAGVLVMRCCDNIRLYGDWQPELWFFGPAFGYQSVCFQPDHYEDISAYMARKKKAVAEYECVDIWNGYAVDQTAEKFHGYSAGVLYAEAFCRCHFRAGQARFDVVGEGRSPELTVP